MRVVKDYRRLVKKAVSAYEDWAIQCLGRAKKLHDESNHDDAMHFELEADYWFSMAEKLTMEAHDSNFLACPNCGSIIYNEHK